MRKVVAVAAALTSLLVGTATANAAPDPGADDTLVTGEGYQDLRLGMSEQDGLATGRLTEFVWDDGNCDWYHTVYRPNDWKAAVFSHTDGLVDVRTPPEAHTPAGITTGSTVAQLKAAYPNVKQYRNGYTATVPGYSDRFYDFWIEGDDPYPNDYPADAKVVQINLDLVNAYC
ncbi:hypothetical protein ACFQ1S_17035 [Kibdelosporangium lantanae]|uniref:Peptidase inhibitor family I36 n=1 Tax=Kibdelosporangium lantanae TaxID=1497396 RepID=A0ABW3M980_9PSEU